MVMLIAKNAHTIFMTCDKLSDETYYIDTIHLKMNFKVNGAVLVLNLTIPHEYKSVYKVLI